MAGTASARPAAHSRASAGKSAFAWLLALLLGATFVFSLRAAQVDPRLFFDRASLANLGDFVARMFPPKVSPDFLALLAWPVVQTIQISVAGMVLALAIGIPLGLLASASFTWQGVLHERRTRLGVWIFGVVPYALARALLSVFRSIPELVWALVFVRALGLGAPPGVLAIGVAYGGMLGKVYSEILETVSSRPLEALQATGAPRSGIVLYGLLPEALPHLVSYTLYRWECAIRASAILGFVGAGGLGLQIELSMRMFEFDEVLTELALLFVLVAAVDLVSSRVRARLAV